MTPQHYDYLRKLLKERSGLDLSIEKRYLVESRLQPLARKAGFSGIDGLVEAVKAGAAQHATDLVEAMTTNETFFFRDKVPFEQFRDVVVSTLMQTRGERRTIRIWCAASSTGQEPYSLAICLKEMGAVLAGWRVEILASDLSQGVLAKSKAGIYNQFEVQRGLPIQMLMKYFKQSGDQWQINADIRAMVQFKQLNLLHDFAHLGIFDLIFCRNVLIYFDQPTKARVLEKLASVLEPNGILALGAAETVIGLNEVFKPWAQYRGLYRLNRADLPAPATGYRADQASSALRS